ncbi:MAG: TraR/DksA C4-type zinc finger protein [Chloroflexi bacterium]|nr:TraR/DksA C4-type zinc finger protein [Chloroflexota bacterium]MCY3958636.1 TraR/DksA C4-type zinc finger protein [Chloroflexota bacterium]
MSETQIDGLADSAHEASARDLHMAIQDVLGALPSGASPGQCQDCGGQIEPLRLDLLPGTSQCAACARRRAGIVTPSLN